MCLDPVLFTDKSETSIGCVDTKLVADADYYLFLLTDADKINYIFLPRIIFVHFSSCWMQIY